MPDLVGGEVVDDDDAGRLQLGDQRLFQPLPKQLAGHRTGQEHRRQDAAMTQGRDEGLGHPVAVRCLADEFFALTPPRDCQ